MSDDDTPERDDDEAVRADDDLAGASEEETSIRRPRGGDDDEPELPRFGSREPSGDHSQSLFFTSQHRRQRQPGDEPCGVDLLDQPRLFPLAATSERWLASLPRRDYANPAREPTLHLDLEREMTFGEFEFREVAIPNELQSDLHELVPQAILRDLHRPEKYFAIELERLEGSVSVGSQLDEELTRVREARRLEARLVIEPSVQWVREYAQQRRVMLDEEWKAILPDDAERKRVTF